MTTPLHLEVPQAKDPPPSRGGLSGLAFVLLLILLVVNVMRFFVAPPGTINTSRNGGGSGMPGADQIKSVAIDLENKNISGEAADLWERYLEMAKLTALEAGNVRYRVAKLRFAAGQYDKAFAQYALAEKMLGDSSPDLIQEISLKRVDCLRRLGRWAEVSREMADRATIGADDAGVTGQQVVAEIDGQKITVSEFDLLLSNQIEMAVSSRLGLSAEDQNALRRRAHEQFADPQIRQRELQRIVAMRVLAQEARERDLDKSAEFRDRLQAVADGILGQTLLFEESAKRGTVTNEDVERFYQANTERYAQPAATFIAHVLCKTKEQADEVIRRVNEGASFEEIAKIESLDADTQDKMGIYPTPVSATGELVPMFGANAELHDAIREGEASRILDKPYESPRGWHVIKIVSHRERIEQPLDEIRQRVHDDTVATRNREVSEQFVTELFEANRVTLYPEALGVGGSAKAAPPSSSVNAANTVNESKSDENGIAGDTATP
jgi:peptidyl-prolyl cis-trans isomerase C